MADLPSLPLGEATSTWFASAAAGLSAGGAALYGLWRTLKAQSRQDRTDDASEAMRDDLRAQLLLERERADQFARERNDLVAKVARLEAEVEALKLRLGEIAEDRRQLKGEVSRLEREVDLLFEAQPSQRR